MSSVRARLGASALAEGAAQRVRQSDRVLGAHVRLDDEARTRLRLVARHVPVAERRPVRTRERHCVRSGGRAAGRGGCGGERARERRPRPRAHHRVQAAERHLLDEHVLEAAHGERHVLVAVLGERGGRCALQRQLPVPPVAPHVQYALLCAVHIHKLSHTIRHNL